MWAPTRDADGHKDYIQVGDVGHTPGKSHIKDIGYWPPWADNTGWNIICFLPGFILGKNTPCDVKKCCDHEKQVILKADDDLRLKFEFDRNKELKDQSPAEFDMR